MSTLLGLDLLCSVHHTHTHTHTHTQFAGVSATIAHCYDMLGVGLLLLSSNGGCVNMSTVHIQACIPLIINPWIPSFVGDSIP